MSTGNHPDAVTGDAELRSALGLLRRAVTLPWESVDQVLREHAVGGAGSADAPGSWGDVSTPATPAWHLRHALHIFRVHAATWMGETPPPDGAMSALPAEPGAVREALLVEIDRFSAWLSAQPPGSLQRPVHYGQAWTGAEMLSIMLNHIVWHAAAAHYALRAALRMAARSADPGR